MLQIVDVKTCIGQMKRSRKYFLFFLKAHSELEPDLFSALEALELIHIRPAYVTLLQKLL